MIPDLTASDTIFQKLMYNLDVKAEQIPIIVREANMILARLAPTLEGLCQEYGYRYVLPTLTIEGAELLITSPKAFLEQYKYDLMNPRLDSFKTDYC